MRFDLHLRATVKEQIEQLAETMVDWEEQPRLDEDEIARIREGLVSFEHTTAHEGLRIAGVDGSGDFPALSYADSFVYFCVAQGTLYASDALSGLREVGPVADPVTGFPWLPEDEERRRIKLDEAFSALAGMPIERGRR